MLARGGTLGCFQIESPGMRNLLQQTAAEDMDDVIQAIALIRPGPASSGMKDAYVRRFRGLEEPRAPHPRLSELLWDTYGVMLYQEDVMQVVSLMAGIELSEADVLRRALCKRRGPELERLRARYFDGCRVQGIEREGAARVWELVANFASFGFCKAHAVTYGRIAYRAAYLKAHHPAAYLTAFLNSETGYYPARVYVEEARRLGVAILPPDVNRSRAGFSLEDAGDGGGDALRVGLGRVQGLGEATLGAILAQRERGPYLSLPDFLARTAARVDEIERLVQCGAFDAFDRTRPEMLWRLHLLTGPTRRLPRLAPGEPPLDAGQLEACRRAPDERARESARAPEPRTGGWSRRGFGVGALELAPLESAALFPDPPSPAVALPALPAPDPATRGRLELELLGLSVASHPTELFPCVLEASGRPPTTIPCGALARHRGRRVSVRGWIAASRRVHGADGRWMRFVTLEDTDGLAEVVLFAAVYRRDGHRLVHRGPFLISGVVEDQLGACTLHAEHIW
jgi:DNA polymerase III alpha subunit